MARSNDTLPFDEFGVEADSISAQEVRGVKLQRSSNVLDLDELPGARGALRRGPLPRGRSRQKQAETQTGLAANKVASCRLPVVGLREVGAAVVAETTVIRRQAFTLLFRAWDEVRRAVGFLRWKQGDADSIAPNFYLGRAKGRRAASDKPEAQADATAPAEPAAATADAKRTNGTAVRTPGMPGISPLVN